MATGTVGTQARQFPWQMLHYVQRGTQNDPAGPPTTVSGGGNTPVAGGVFSWNSTYTLPQPPGSGNAPPRVQTITSTSGATSTTTIATNNGGILIGTLPQGAWIDSVAFQIFTTFAGGTADTLALAYAAANTVGTVSSNWAPTTLNMICNLTTLTAGYYHSGATADGLTQLSKIFGLTNWGALPALNSDIDLYVVVYKAVAPAVAFTAGSAAVKVTFTGLGG